MSERPAHCDWYHPRSGGPLGCIRKQDDLAMEINAVDISDLYFAIPYSYIVQIWGRSPKEVRWLYKGSSVKLI